MEQKLADTAHKAYGYTHMKKRLQEPFGEKIILTEINGKSNVATFRTTARAVLHEYYKQQQQDKNTTEETMKLIQAAARLIKEDIKSITMTHDVYPSCDDLRSQEAGTEFLPDTLKELLKKGFFLDRILELR